MAEYIEREALRKILDEWRDAHADVDDVHGCGLLEDVICEVDAQTAADVAPVVHGRWAHLGGDEWCCPVCGFVITTEGSWDKPTKKYCEDCGAKMDGNVDEIGRAHV